MADCICFGRRKKGKKPEKKQDISAKESNEQCTTRSVSNPNPDTGKQKTDGDPGPSSSSSATQDVGREKARVFNYRDLVTATKNFHRSTFLGEGGFGTVYRGQLITGEVFAVKRLNPSGTQGEKEFLVEVLMLSLLHHPNLLNLIGYCAEGSQRLLVLEFMPFGSLEHHLHGLAPEKVPLDWNTRMKIAAGTARGVDYLHNVAKPPVIYRDLKPSNILLDEEYHPKLSDFGLAKFGPVGDKSHVSTRVMGTYGYCAPEYARTGKLTPKSDTYSFGVVLLEIISGRKAYDLTRPSSQVSLAQWVLPLLKDRKNFVQLADPKLNGQFPKSDLHHAIEVAAMCLREDAKKRPSMDEVAVAMEFLTSQRHGLPKIRGTEANPRRPSPKRPIGKSPLGLRSSPMSPGESPQSPGNSPMSPRKLPLIPGKSPLSPGRSPRVSYHDGDRDQAVAEAKMWGEKWREKRQQGAGSSSSANS